MHQIRNTHEVLLLPDKLGWSPQGKVFTSLPLPFLRNTFQTGTVIQGSVVLLWTIDNCAFVSLILWEKKGKNVFCSLAVMKTNILQLHAVFFNKKRTYTLFSSDFKRNYDIFVGL